MTSAGIRPHLLWVKHSDTQTGLEIDRLLTENSRAPYAVLWAYIDVNRPHTDTPAEPEVHLLSRPPAPVTY
ncbi:hypothetical protein QM588_15085 [Rhodococcus sp. IEGM 1354]|uniref:hypothetical protein n=1 Tax=Rhodococcus sp. IEGM 1354 TaxID=3047088 RepID=UPI0024B6C7DA|nr:hypothetical protein [Rhodococcus sp. IEGM 1354]MDI9931730.1 hypothetical protein [Rhodococcus sp. IEGM 1354]